MDPKERLATDMAPRTPSARPDRGGFTLLELIVVLMVIGVVMAIASPRLSGFFASRQTADAAARVAALAEWARSEAIARGHTCRLNIDAQANTCWVSVQRQGAFEAADGEAGQTFSFPEGAQVTLKLSTGEAGVTFIQFYPSGRSDVATLQIRGRGGEQYVVANGSPTDRFRVLSNAEAFKT